MLAALIIIHQLLGVSFPVKSLLNPVFQIGTRKQRQITTNLGVEEEEHGQQ